jgi:hypothetical protein
MGDRYLTDLDAVLRAAGLTVETLDGWQTRSRSSGGYDPGYPSHVMVHHTASPPSASGESDASYCTFGDEDAPLCNVYLDADGVWWVCAAGATNCNGKGGPLDGVPADSMNLAALAVEANGGYGYPWPAAETSSYVTGVAALVAAYAVGYVRAHFEWAPTRKVDPAGASPWSPDDRSWNMDAFRADVAAGSGGSTGGDDMPLSDDDLDRVAARVWQYMIGEQNAGAHLRQAHMIPRFYLGPWKPGWELPDPTTLERIDRHTS